MAKISITDPEITDSIILLEQLVPGLNLEVAKSMLKGVVFQGSHIFMNKAMEKDHLTIEIDVS